MPLLLHRGSSATMVERVESSKKRKRRKGLGEKRRVKSEKEGKVSLFITPRIIKFRLLDFAQYKSMIRGLGTRSTIGIRDLFEF